MPSKQQTNQNKRIREHQKLLAEALKRPGVRQVMELYQAAQKVEDIVAQHLMLLAPRSVVSASNGTSER